jgi:hypothetical protein
LRGARAIEGVVRLAAAPEVDVAAGGNDESFWASGLERLIHVETPSQVTDREGHDDHETAQIHRSRERMSATPGQESKIAARRFGETS